MAQETQCIPEVEEKHVTGVYNNIANHFEHTRQYRWNWIDEFVYSIPYSDDKDERTSTIYDIGCGTGRNMTGYDSQITHRFIGVDSCPKFVELCKSKGLECVESSMTELPFEDETADAIVCIAAFHHLSTVERRIKALEEMARVMRYGSKLLLSVWSKTQPKKTKRVFEEYGDNMVLWNKYGEIFQRYYYIFQLDELCDLFDTSGFRIVTYKWECGNEVFVLEKK